MNKGDAENPDYRSKLVATEIKADNRDDLLAATPIEVSDARMASWFVTAVLCVSASEASALASKEFFSVVGG